MGLCTLGDGVQRQVWVIKGGTNTRRELEAGASGERTDCDTPGLVMIAGISSYLFKLEVR